MVRVRWLKKGEIAHSSIPHNVGDIQYLYEQGIRAIVSCCDISVNVLEKIVELGIRHIMIPVEMMAAPTKMQIRDFLVFLDEAMLGKQPCLVQSFEGEGRAKTMLALYLVHNGFNPQAAINAVGGVETAAQRQCILDYSNERNWPKTFSPH